MAVVGLCAFLALWYGAGFLVNRRRGQRLYHWFVRGQDMLGADWKSVWIGSPASGVRFSVMEASPPFQQVEVILLLENREIMPFWLLDRLRGRRDWLILKATLRQARPGEVEVLPVRSRVVRVCVRRPSDPGVAGGAPRPGDCVPRTTARLPTRR